MNANVKQSAYVPEPVSIEREENDVIVIEGVRYSGDLFRTNAWPNQEVLYVIRRDDEGVVCVTEIRDVPGAMEFFGAKVASDEEPIIEGVQDGT